MRHFKRTVLIASAGLLGAGSIAAAPGVGAAYRGLAHAAPQAAPKPHGGAGLSDLLRLRLRGMGPVTILPSLPAQADPGLAPLFPGAEVDPRTGRIRLPEFGVCILPTYPAQVAPGQDAALAPRLKTFRFHHGGPLFIEPEVETLFVPHDLADPGPE